MIGIIAAVSVNNVIGKNNSIPWNYPDDMAFFKKATLNSTVIMGYNTFRSLKGALPKRQNIVLSPVDINGVEVASSIPDALEKSKNNNVWFIGGGMVYEQAFTYANEILLTRIPEIIEDTDAVFFPDIPPEFVLDMEFSIGEKLNVERYRKY